MGAFDYVMTQTRNESYMSNFTSEQLTFFYGFPSWLVAAWAIAVWGGVLGSVFLLLRNKLAIWMFVASLVCMIITTVHNYGFSNGMQVIGDTFSLIVTAVIFLIAVALLLYSKAMHARRVIA